MPPIKDFKDDAGARSNLTTMNVMSIVADRFVCMSALLKPIILRDSMSFKELDGGSKGESWLVVYGVKYL